MISLPNRHIYVLGLFILLSNFLFSQENWKLIKDDNGIRIYTKTNAKTNFKTFRANMIIDASIDSFVALLNDIDAFKGWGYKTKEAKLLNRSGDTLLIMYSTAKSPFPFRDRDGIYLDRFKWNKETKTLNVEIEILDKYLELKNNLVRIKGEGFWRVVVLPSRKIDITFQLQIDPGGTLPIWLSNVFVDDLPYFTLMNLRDFIKKDKYQHIKYDFID